MSLTKKQRRLDTSALVDTNFLPSNRAAYEPQKIRIFEHGESDRREYGERAPSPQDHHISLPVYTSGQQQQIQQPVLQQQQQQQQQEPYVTKTVATETTVLQYNHMSVLRLCLIPLFVVIICLLLIAIFWNIQHNSPHGSGNTPISYKIPRTAWTNTSNEAVKTGKVYSLYYPYTISVFDDWEQIPRKGEPGIPGLSEVDFERLVSIHSCCRTKEHRFICANTNRIDGAAFDIRLIEENKQVYLQVFPVTRLMVGAECKLELELVDE
jgi:hypothetical protein